MPASHISVARYYRSRFKYSTGRFATIAMTEVDSMNAKIDQRLMCRNRDGYWPLTQYAKAGKGDQQNYLVSFS